MKNISILLLLITATANAAIFGNVEVEQNLTLSGKTASTVPYLDGSKNLVSSAVTPTELGYLSGVTSAIQAQIDLKRNLNDSTAYYVGPLSSGRPYQTISAALAAMGSATSEADFEKARVVYIAGGAYDESITIPRGRIITLVAEGTVILGDGLLANFGSNTARSITFEPDTADLFGSDIKPSLNLIGMANNDPTSTFVAESGGFIISGNVNIDGSGVSHTVNLSNTKIQGAITKTTLGLTNLFGYKLYVVGASNLSAGQTILERCYDCEFDNLLTLDSYNAILNSELNGGMTVASTINAMPPSGMFHTTFFGTFTGPANSLKLDLSSDYFFRANGATLGGAATKVLLAPVATASITGVLSSTDFSTFNGKQDALVNSAGLAAALNDETGTGLAVFGTSPALLGSPTAPTQTALDNSTKIATTAYVDSAVSPFASSLTEKVYVSKAGSDVTGNGSFNRPYASVAAALASITDAANAKRYSIEVGAGQFAEASFAMKPWIQIKGQGHNTTRFTVTGNFITLDSSFNTGVGRAELRDMYLTGTTGVNWDLQTVGGVGAQAVLELHDVQMNGSLTFKGRSNNLDAINIKNAYIFNSAVLDTGSSNTIRNLTTTGNLTLTANVASSFFDIMDLHVYGNLISSATIGTNSISLRGSYLSGTLSASGATTITADPASLPSLAASATLTGGAVITPIANAMYMKFEPGTPANWSVAPTIVSQALDLLAADKLNASALVQTITNGDTTHVSSSDALFDALALKESLANKGVAGGYAPLDGSAKIDVSYLPAAVLGAVNYQGGWNATTNSPALASGVGTKGHYYVVGTAGGTSIDGVSSWGVGDWIVFNGTIWQKVDNNNAVTSVFGRTGAVVAATSDYDAVQVDNTPAGAIAATNVQAAIDELDSEKQALLVNSAGLAAALSDETGTGAAVFAVSPALTGSPTAPTQTAGDNSTKIATTAYVDAAAAAAGGVNSVFGRTGTVVAATSDYDAIQVDNTPAGNIAATNVQAALNELDSEKEPSITATSSADYYRGDKTFQPFNAAAIGSVLTGYTSGAGVVAATDTILQAIQKLNGNTAALVTGVSSVFGRTGAVVSSNGDYTASQVTNVAYDHIAAVTVQAAINELVDEKERILEVFAVSTSQLMAPTSYRALYKANVSGGSISLTLPLAAGLNNRIITVKNISAANDVNVIRNVPDNIEGGTSDTLGPHESRSYISNAATDTWYTIND